MQRRELFTSAIAVLSRGDSEQQALDPTGTLAAWIPTKDNPWDERAVLHFYNRIGFAPTRAEVQSALRRSPKDLLREAMEDEWCSTRLPGILPGWENWLYVQPYQGTEHLEWEKQEALYQGGKHSIRLHWCGLMSEPGSFLREKLALFWHNHFVVDVEKLYFPKHLHEYLELLRVYSWGDLKQFAKDVTILPAMLIYLDGVKSIKDGLNENYAREMLELFLVGRTDKEGKPTYSQNDVRDIAFALAGWQYWIEAPGPDIVPAYFAEYYFDFDTLRSPFGSTPEIYGLMSAKELGVYKNFVGKIQTDIIDLIFEKRAGEIARHIAQKVYVNFVSNDMISANSQEVVEGLANLLRTSNWNLKPMLESLFLSEHFFDPTFRGCLIKSPLELVIGTMRHLDIEATLDHTFCAMGLANNMNQTLASPPNVKGWPGYRAWLDSSTLGKRNVLFTSILAAGGKVTVESREIIWSDDCVIAWARQFSSFSTSVMEFTLDVLRKLIVFAFSTDDVNSLLNRAGVATTIPWGALSDASKVGLIRSIVGASFMLPHYQLN